MGIEPLLTLGFPIARLLMRLYNHDLPDLAHATEDVQKLLGTVADRAKRRQIGRHLEELTDLTLQSLDHHITIEFPSLSGPEIAVAAEVAASITSKAGGGDLTTIIKLDLDANTLEQFLIERGDVKNNLSGLSEPESELVKTVLRQLSHAMVEVVRTHPVFTIAALEALLVRSTDLKDALVAVDVALRQLPEVVVDRNTGAFDERRRRLFEEFSVEYRRGVVTDYDKLELYGVDLNRKTARYSLTMAYLSLKVTRQTDEKLEGREYEVRVRTTSPPMDLANVFPESGMLVLRGEAGAGKSTILQWLAVGTARRTFTGQLSHLNNSTPFFLRLRNYADLDFPSMAQLPHVTARHLALTQPEGWFNNIYSSGKILLLLDGLDELPKTRHGDFIKWLEHFQEIGRRVLAVVTTRPSAQDEAEEICKMWEVSNPTVDVLPMDHGQMRSFIYHWHVAIARKLPAGLDRDDFLGDSPRVTDALTSSREYTQLASSPLLCAVLCALFHQRRGAIPQRRLGIYDTLLTLLLETREIERRVAVDVIPLDGSEKRLILEDIAQFLLENDLSECETYRAESVIANSPIVLAAGIDAGVVLRHLVARSGVLRSPAVGRVDFVHRTFLEYLGARAEIRGDYIEKLANNVLQSTWNEAVVLATGIGNRPQVDKLVGMVVDQTEAWLAQNPARDSYQHYPVDSTLETLTITCSWFLTIAVLLSQELRRRILTVISWMVPPDKLSSARACASAGNGILPILRDALQSDGLTANQLTMSIRALGEIGTDESLAVLSQIPADRRIDAIRDLIAVWTWFNPNRFANDVLKPLTPADMLDVTLPSSTFLPIVGSLSPNFAWDCKIDMPQESLMDDCRNATVWRLEVHNLDVLQSAEAQTAEFIFDVRSLRLASLFGLRGLSLPRLGAAAEDLEVLEMHFLNGVVGRDIWPAVSNLRDLRLSGTAQLDMVSLGSLTHLTTLAVDGELELLLIDDFDLLALKELDCRNFYDLDSIIKLISAAPNLERLSITAIEGVSDLEFLSGLDSLQTLELEEMVDLEDVSQLLELASLNAVLILGSHKIVPSETISALMHRLDLDIREGIDLEDIPEILDFESPYSPWATPSD